MTCQFEPDYRQKILYITFDVGSVIGTLDDILQLRQEWLGALKSWHSPYKALINATQLTISGDPKELAQGFGTMEKLLKGFFLKKACVYGSLKTAGLECLPFPLFATEEEAAAELGIRTARVPEVSDFRSQIHVDNHFQQHTIELTFSGAVEIDSQEKLSIFKQKLMNNLMQWHSSWNLLIDCQNLKISQDLFGEFQKITEFFQRFFLKDIIGYNAGADKTLFPFETYRSRHKAAAVLEGEGRVSGEDANCRSRKPGT